MRCLIQNLAFVVAVGVRGGGELRRRNNSLGNGPANGVSAGSGDESPSAAPLLDDRLPAVQAFRADGVQSAPRGGRDAGLLHSGQD